jgi:hypothetical protein
MSKPITVNLCDTDTKKEKRREYMRIYKQKQYANSNGVLNKQQQMYEYRRRLGNDSVTVEKCIALGEKLPILCNISKWVDKFRENESDENILQEVSIIEQILKNILKQ